MSGKPCSCPFSHCLVTACPWRPNKPTRGGAVSLDDLTRDLFRMPDEPPTGCVETCPECMTRGQQPVTWHRPDTATLTCAYTCTNCRCEWECSWWQEVA